jgi:hypothetical protein
MEIAVNVPFEASEIIHIVAEELQARLRGLSPLSQSKEYAAFSVEYQVKVRLRRTGETKADERETMAWGTVESPKGVVFQEDNVVLDVLSERYESKDPNEERVDRDMPLTVETGDGRGGKIRKKIKVKA